jgi:hypothetical protein
VPPEVLRDCGYGDDPEDDPPPPPSNGNGSGHGGGGGDIGGDDDPGLDDSENEDDPADDLDEYGGTAGSDAAIKAARAKAKAKREAVIDEMNKKYAVVNDGGSVLIFRDRYDEPMKRYVYDRMAQTSFLLLHKNETVCTSVSDNGSRTYKPIGAVWLTHKRRRAYKNGVVFDPTTTESRGGYLDLWRVNVRRFERSPAGFTNPWRACCQEAETTAPCVLPPSCRPGSNRTPVSRRTGRLRARDRWVPRDRAPSA